MFLFKQIRVNDFYDYAALFYCGMIFVLGLRVW